MASEEDKAKADALKAEGNALYKKREFEAALKKYDEAIALNPQEVTYRNNKCAVYMEMGDHEAVEREGKAAIEAGREARVDFEILAKIYVRMAKSAVKAGDISRGIELYRTAQVEHFTKDTERAIKNLELEERKKKAQAYIDPEEGLKAKERGNGFFREGKFPDAIREYEDACKRDPTNPAYPNNLAAALTKIGDFAGAKRSVEKALDLDPTYVKAWVKTGDLHVLSKEYHKALDAYKRGLAIDPNNAACKQGMNKTLQMVNSGSSADEKEQQERARHAMADPEIQAILQDPVVRNVLSQLSTDPKAAQAALADPDMRTKIEKLVASGVLQMK